MMDYKFEVFSGLCGEKLKSIKSDSIDNIIFEPLFDIEINKEKDFIFQELYRVLKENSILILFGKRVPLISWNLFIKSNFSLKKTVVWDKKNIIKANFPLPYNSELLYIFSKGNVDWNESRIKTIEKYISWHIVIQNTKRILLENLLKVKSDWHSIDKYPTQKMIDSMETYIKLISNEDDTTLLSFFIGKESIKIGYPHLKKRYGILKMRPEVFEYYRDLYNE